MRGIISTVFSQAIQIQPVASGFASPVTVTNAGDGTRCNQLGGARPQAAPNELLVLNLRVQRNC